MAKSKTASFWLTESIDLTALATAVQSTIDLGAYVDVGDQQAVAIEQVDMILQSHDTANNTYSNSIAGILTDNGNFGMQLTDLNPGTAFVRADDNTLIASGSVYFDDANYIASTGPDLYPDTYGKIDESRLVVNDNLYVVARCNSPGAFVANRAATMTLRIKARIVKLSTKDWMAIAIQSTAADN